MLINEFTNAPDLKDVDLVEDLHFFMQNDPTFYRKILFPLISKLKAAVKGGQSASADMFRGSVDKAVDAYCRKFKIPGNPKSVFTDVDRDSLASKIFGQEKENISKGTYDGDDQ